MQWMDGITKTARLKTIEAFRLVQNHCDWKLFVATAA